MDSDRTKLPIFKFQEKNDKFLGGERKGREKVTLTQCERPPRKRLDIGRSFGSVLSGTKDERNRRRQLRVNRFSSYFIVGFV